MSEVLRVGLVCEGPTDEVVVNAAMISLLGNRVFFLTQLQPLDSLAFGRTGTGWAGVYQWCQQAVDQGAGTLRNNALLESFDLLILHIDADVADQTYGSGNIATPLTNLPCARPCPPASDTTDLLRDVVLSWLGEVVVPPHVVFCTPSKSTEAWVLAALFPTDAVVRSGLLECHPTPANLLSTKPLGQRIKKTTASYRQCASEITRNWGRVRGLCAEAERFSSDFLAEAVAA